MGDYLLAHLYDTVAVVLFGIGFVTLLLNQNLVKKIIGLNIADTAVYLFLASKGFIAGRQVPIVGEGAVDPARYINPIPAGLILTGIVISVSVTAFALALTVRLFKRYNTLYLDEILRLSRQEED